MKKVLCTFGSLYITKGFPRYIEQAESMNIFDEIRTLSEADLSKEFVRKWGRYMHPYSRGYGYWCWKAHLILKILESMEDGDILLYTDVGCFFNPMGRDRLLEYYKMVEEHPTGIMGVQSQQVSYNDIPETLYYEFEWTKGDVFDYYGVKNDITFTQTTQFESGVVFFRKGPVSLQFVRDWDKAYQEDYSLATDSPSRTPNLRGFRENRHDQSIYSMLAKKYDIARISTNEIFVRDWNLLLHYPIHAQRDKAYPTKLHYKHRFRLRNLYKQWWKIKNDYPLIHLN